MPSRPGAIQVWSLEKKSVLKIYTWKLSAHWWHWKPWVWTKPLGWGRGPSNFRVQGDEDEAARETGKESPARRKRTEGVLCTSERSVLSGGMVNCANWGRQAKQDENWKLIVGYGHTEDTDQNDTELLKWWEQKSWTRVGSKGEELYAQAYFFLIKKIRENKAIAGRDVGSCLHTGRNDPGKRENTGKYRGESTNAK